MSPFVLLLVKVFYCDGRLSFIWFMYFKNVYSLLFLLNLKLKLLRSVLIASLLEGDQTLLNCPDGQYVGFTHGRYFYNSCGTDVTTALNINCCNHQSCLIRATNDWLGVDPCVGDTKTLEWTMICRGKKKREWSKGFITKVDSLNFVFRNANDILFYELQHVKLKKIAFGKLKN